MTLERSMQDSKNAEPSNAHPAVTLELAPLFSDIAAVIQQSRYQVQQAVNSAMVQCYWHIDRLIVEHEQQGQTRAAYGKHHCQNNCPGNLAKVLMPAICAICELFSCLSKLERSTYRIELDPLTAATPGG